MKILLDLRESLLCKLFLLCRIELGALAGEPRAIDPVKLFTDRLLHNPASVGKSSFTD
jgi:hypothetical protein